MSSMSRSVARSGSNENTRSLRHGGAGGSGRVGGGTALFSRPGSLGSRSPGGLRRRRRRGAAPAGPVPAASAAQAEPSSASTHTAFLPGGGLPAPRRGPSGRPRGRPNSIPENRPQDGPDRRHRRQIHGQLHVLRLGDAVGPTPGSSPGSRAPCRRRAPGRRRPRACHPRTPRRRWWACRRG